MFALVSWLWTRISLSTRLNNLKTCAVLECWPFIVFRTALGLLCTVQFVQLQMHSVLTLWIHRVLIKNYQCSPFHKEMVNVPRIDVERLLICWSLYHVHALSLGHSAKSDIISYYHFHLQSYSCSTLAPSVPLKLCKPGVPIRLMELPLVSSIKRGISIFQLVCGAHLKGLGHKMLYLSTGYASCW